MGENYLILIISIGIFVGWVFYANSAGTDYFDGVLISMLVLRSIFHYFGIIQDTIKLHSGTNYMVFRINMKIVVQLDSAY